MPNIFINVDSNQAEGRVVSLLADDEATIAMYDTHDIHAVTAASILGGTEQQYSKKLLGYECPERFFGKTARHAFNLGAGPRRLMLEANTQARKYRIAIEINQTQADRALKILHEKQPKIQQVFHAGIIKALESRSLTAPIPYGIDSKVGGKRIFYERWGDELFRQAFSYIPQRAVSDNTKAAGMRIKKIIPSIRIIVEAHDSLLFAFDDRYYEEIIPIIKQEFERPINFNNCSLPRRHLKIPCEIEVGYNYQDLSKYKGKM